MFLSISWISTSGLLAQLPSPMRAHKTTNEQLQSISVDKSLGIVLDWSTINPDVSLDSSCQLKFGKMHWRHSGAGIDGGWTTGTADQRIDISFYISSLSSEDARNHYAHARDDNAVVSSFLGPEGLGHDSTSSTYAHDSGHATAWWFYNVSLKVVARNNGKVISTDTAHIAWWVHRILTSSLQKDFLSHIPDNKMIHPVPPLAKAGQHIVIAGLPWDKIHDNPCQFIPTTFSSDINWLSKPGDPLTISVTSPGIAWINYIILDSKRLYLSTGSIDLVITEHDGAVNSRRKPDSKTNEL